MRARALILTILLGMQMCAVTTAVYADTAVSQNAIPAGVKEVKDPKTGEIRYRLSNEQESDPRTYTYEEMMISESGYEPEGLEQYDEQDNYRDIVSIGNFDIFSSYYNDGYNIGNLKVWLANYMYYFTEDDDAHYNCSIIPGTIKTSPEYGGIIKFDIELDGRVIACEYHKKFKMFGFKSDIGDMSLKAQFVISERGHRLSRKTLLEYAAGTLNDLTGSTANYRRGRTDKVWVGSAYYNGRNIAANRWFFLDDGADDRLINSLNYSESQIKDMLIYLEEKNGDKVEFTDCLPELVDFYKESHADIAGMLAIAVTAGNHKEGSNAEYWNFFNVMPAEGKTSVSGNGLWNAKADCETEGEAMVEGFQHIYKDYWLKGQNTFYKMMFGGYGSPQNPGEAETAGDYKHCYSPWFADYGYVRSGFDDYYAWCNRCARNRKELLKAAGLC